MKSLRTLLALTLLSASLATGMSPAHAGLIYQQSSESNPANPAALPNAYRISNIEVDIDSDNSDILIVKVNLPENPRADLLSGNTTKPLLRIKLFKKYTKGQPVDGGYGDVWIDSPATAYQFMGVQSPAPVSAMKSIGASPYDPRISLPDCQGKSWLETFGQEPWVKFSVSMSCIKLPDKFSVLAFIDFDQNASYQTDYKFAPLTPMAVDISTIARPRPKDSQSITVNQLSTYDLLTKSVNVTANAQRFNLYGDAIAPNPIRFNSLTPAICAFPSGDQGALNLLTKGTCTVEAYAIGDSNVAESNRAQMSFTVNPIPMISQNLTYYRPYNVTFGDPEFEVNVSTTSGLPLVLKSFDANICYFKDPVNRPLLVTITGSGTCEFSVTQAGNERYYSTSGTAYFEIAEKYVPTPESTKKPETTPTKAPEVVFGGTGSAGAGSVDVNTKEKTDALAQKAVSKTTIICKNIKKSSQIKKVTDVKPKCPPGYKKY